MKIKYSIPPKTIERLVIYRRELEELKANRLSHLYSHQLAELANNTSAQVRRDLMIIGCSGGNPRNGYNIEDLIENINDILEAKEGQKIALVGVGNLGKAILSYSSYRHSSLSIVAAFDTDKEIIGNSFSNCKCYHMDELKDKISELGIEIGIITAPGEYAQQIADSMVKAGIKGILNFAPASLNIPADVYLDRIDITMILDKIGYFTQNMK
jgi:redox-sensing transcriptional repressor